MQFKSIIISLMIFSGLFQTAKAKQARSSLVGDSIAIFYPANFQAKLTLPSLALKPEPSEKGSVPANWLMKPVFREFNGKQIAEFYAGKDVSLYGTGEVTGPLLRNGRDVTLWNTDNFTYRYDSTRLYQSHPWVLGVRPDGTAFGIIADHTYRQRIITRDTIRFESDGPAFRVIVIERASPQGVMKALGELTGNMPLPPLWALGYQQCRWSYETADRVKEIANGFRSRHIPCDVIWMDIDYMNGFRIFTFDSIKFPDPKGLNDYLHQNDFKAVWMIDPGVKVDNDYSVYKTGTKEKHWVLDSQKKPYTGDVWPGPCHFPDFTQPKTQKWWAGLYTDFMATGIDGVWNDMNEPAVFNGPDKTMPIDNRHKGGDGIPKGLHSRYHNVYGLLMVRSSREGITNINTDKRPFILSRSNFLGGQRYAATWTGDNESSWAHLKLSIPMSLSLSLSGQPFNGPDIGGFSKNPSPELYAHWIALGAFYPFSRGHACQGTIDKEPWVFGAEVENVARIALERRYMLLPYMYTLFHEASEANMPIMRPLFFADATDAALRNQQQTFLLGGDLMIIPQWAKDVVYPKGFSQSIKLGNEMDGDKYQPELVQRSGSIIPIGKVIESTQQFSTDSLQLITVLDDNGEATGKLYTDKGEGYGFQNGDFELVEIKARLVGEQLKFTVIHLLGNSKNKRSYQFIVYTDKGVLKSDWQGGDAMHFRLK